MENTELTNNGFYYFDYKGAKIPYCKYEKRIYVECKGLSTVVGTGVAVWLRDNREIVNNYASSHNMKVNKCIIGATILVLELALMYFRSFNSELAEWMESQELTFGEKPEVKIVSDKVELIQTATLLGKQIDVYGSAEKPLFLARDVAEWIEYAKRTDGSYQVGQMLQTIDDDEKLPLTVVTAGQGRQMWFLTENGLYEVLMLSRKPKAKEFKKGIKEILRTIRTTGGYMATREDDTPDEIMARALLVAQETLKRREERLKQLEADNQQKESQIAKLQPKANFADAAFATDDKVDIGMAAKILKLGFGRNTLFQKLRQAGVFFSNRNEPKQRFVNAGYFEMKEKFIERDNHPGFVVTKTLVTQKGLAYINHLFGGNPSDGKLAKMV